MKIIAIDVDDVLADNAAGFVAFSNEHWGTRLTVDDYDEHWAKVWQVDSAETERRAQLFNDKRIVRRYTHREEALEVLRDLKEHYKLVVLTSRRKQLRNDTVEWLATHYEGVFAESDIYFAGIWDTITHASHLQTKTEMAAMIGASYLIDDQLKHVLGVADSGMRGVLFGDYSWNQYAGELPGAVTRVCSWKEVGDYFEHERFQDSRL